MTSPFNFRTIDPDLVHLAKCPARQRLNEITRTIDGAIEERIKLAYESGLDLAVCIEPESAGHGDNFVVTMRLDFMTLTPGCSPPHGRTWTVYRCGDHGR